MSNSLLRHFEDLPDPRVDRTKRYPLIEVVCRYALWLRRLEADFGCQTEIAKKIRGKKADYVLALKGNQGKLHEETKDYFETGLAEKVPVSKGRS